MTNDPNLSREKSLEIIHQMIGQARSNFTESGISWLLWGTMLMLASLSTYFLMIFGKTGQLFMGWNIFGVVSIGLLSYDIFKAKPKKVKTYIDDLMKMVDIGFFICIFVIILSINISVTPGNGFGYMLMVFAFLMLIKGGAVKSRSLMVGAAVNWAGAIGIFYCREFRYDMLIMAAAVFAGYIIPGYLLWSAWKKSNNIPGK